MGGCSFLCTAIPQCTVLVCPCAQRCHRAQLSRVVLRYIFCRSPAWMSWCISAVHLGSGLCVCSLLVRHFGRACHRSTGSLLYLVLSRRKCSAASPSLAAEAEACPL